MRTIFQQILKHGSRGALAGSVLMAASCASSTTSSGPSEGERIVALSEGEGALALDRKFAMQKGDVVYDDTGGLKGGKRSQFEGMQQVQFGGEWNGKDYGKKEFNGRKSWWGSSKNAEVKNYAGGEDASRFMQASRFSSQQAAQSGQASRFDGNVVQTDRYHAGAANEAGVAGVNKPTDAKTDWRRDVYPQPRIMGLKEYKEKSIEETRSLLGRDD